MRKTWPHKYVVEKERSLFWWVGLRSSACDCESVESKPLDCQGIPGRSLLIAFSDNRGYTSHPPPELNRWQVLKG